MTESKHSMWCRVFAACRVRRPVKTAAPAGRAAMPAVAAAGAAAPAVPPDVDGKLRQLCIDTTLLTGDPPREAIGVLDLDAGKLVGTRVGEASTVRVPEPVRALLDGSAPSFRLVHTHPDAGENVSLSEADVNCLWSFPAVTEIEAVLLDGSYFCASRPANVDWDHASRFARADLIKMGVAAAAVEDDHNLGDNAYYNEVRTHIVLLALHQFVLEDEAKQWSVMRARREYGFRYDYTLSAARRARWDAAGNAELIREWVDLTVREFRLSL
ncbi:TPA: hypothetical protein QDB13_005761 [Burkholderia vietnamiensis]|nr:hypothetical protein [Burkholderia vietnamiensis]